MVLIAKLSNSPTGYVPLIDVDPPEKLTDIPCGRKGEADTDTIAMSPAPDTVKESLVGVSTYTVGKVSGVILAIQLFSSDFCNTGIVSHNGQTVWVHARD
jgi:hypothetical protein